MHTLRSFCCLYFLRAHSLKRHSKCRRATARRSRRSNVNQYKYLSVFEQFENENENKNKPNQTKPTITKTEFETSVVIGGGDCSHSLKVHWPHIFSLLFLSISIFIIFFFPLFVSIFGIARNSKIYWNRINWFVFFSSLVFWPCLCFHY